MAAFYGGGHAVLWDSFWDVLSGPVMGAYVAWYRGSMGLGLGAVQELCGDAKWTY